MSHLFRDLFTLPYQQCGIGEKHYEPKQIKLNVSNVVIIIGSYV